MPGSVTQRREEGREVFSCRCWALSRTRIIRVWSRKLRDVGCFPAAPERSLLLRKGAGLVPHGGGVRLKQESEGYNLLRRWIAQGSPDSPQNEATMESLEVQPARGLVRMNSQQQLKAIARYSDGTQRDVTETALFESNERAMAEVSEAGLVQVHDIPGKVAVMVRYQGKVSVFTAAVPAGSSGRLTATGEKLRR